MKDIIEELLVATKNILSSYTNKEELESVSVLNNFYTQFPIKENNTNQDYYLENGIALSCKNAADCITDYKRTARFIKGTYKAIKHLINKFPNTRINILYAGCGPYGPLIIPLLPLFEFEKISVTLIDINKSSIETIKKIIHKLEFESCISDIFICDATKYKYPKNETLHLVVTETMFRALTNEPQVAITQNLAPQIVNGGVLIPQNITISMAYTFFSKEPYLKHFKNEYTIRNESNQQIKRNEITPLFNISIDENKDIESSTPYYFESNWFYIPEKFEETPDICIYTTVKIFDSLKLKNEDSLITNTYCVASLFNNKDHSKFKIQYSTDKLPKWEIYVN